MHTFFFFAHQLKQLAYNADLPDGTPMVQVESSLTPDQVQKLGWNMHGSFNWEELAEAVGDKGLAHTFQEVCRLTKWRRCTSRYPGKFPQLTCTRLGSRGTIQPFTSNFALATLNLVASGLHMQVVRWDESG